MCSDSVARPIMQDSHSCDWGSNPHRSMRVLKLFFKAYLPLLTLIWIILLLVFSIAVSLSFHLGHFINADKLPGVLMVGLGPVVGQVPLPGERDGVFV